MKKFFADFKKFITRGNVIDMAIGVIVGGAFNTIVKTFTDKVIMPIVNLMLSAGGENGLESAYTFLKKEYTDGVVDLSTSIYIDWGAFITAVINFLIIALTLFVIIKVAAKSREVINNTKVKVEKGKATTEEKKILNERGVKFINRKEYKKALKQLRQEVAEKKAEEQREAEANKPVIETDLDILRDIRTLLQKNVEETKEQ